MWHSRIGKGGVHGEIRQSFLSLHQRRSVLVLGGILHLLGSGSVAVCYDLASSLRKRNDVQGEGWLDFNSLSLTNGVARADTEDNIGGARTGGSKG